MPDSQTTEYSATQLVESIKFKLSHTILYCPQKKDMWPSTGLCFTENHPSVSIIHIQSQTVFVAVFFLCFYGKPPLCLFWFSPGSTLSFNQTHPITNCTCHCVFFCDFTARRLSACLGFPQDRPSASQRLNQRKGPIELSFFICARTKSISSRINW